MNPEEALAAHFGDDDTSDSDYVPSEDITSSEEEEESSEESSEDEELLNKIAEDEWESMKSESLDCLSKISRHISPRDEFMLRFQVKRPKLTHKQNSTESELLAFLSLYKNVLNDGEREHVFTKPNILPEIESKIDADLVRRVIQELDNSTTTVLEKEVRFAGQTMKVIQTVEKHSADAQKLERAQKRKAKQSVGGALGGLDDLVSQLKGPAKANTMDKSKSDWKEAKLADKDLAEELRTKNSSFLADQAMMAKADEKSIEIARQAQRRAEQLEEARKRQIEDAARGR